MALTSRFRPAPEEAPLSRRASPSRSAKGVDDGPTSGEVSRPPSSSPVAAFASSVVRELSQYLSEVNSVAILAVCATSLGLKRDQLEPRHLSMILAQVQSSFDFFGVSPERRDRCLAHLRSLEGAMRSSAEGGEDVTVAVAEEQDLVRARLAGRAFCQRLGFNEIDTTKVMTAIAELARNIFKYAGRGEIRIGRLGVGEPACVQVTAMDHGPGIPDVSRVMSPDFRSKTGMGRGLQGTRALMDYFEIYSRPGDGTTVTIRKAKS